MSKTFFTSSSSKGIRIYVDADTKVTIDHDYNENSDTLLPRVYIMEQGAGTSSTFENFSVQIASDDGPPPLYCGFITPNTSDEPQGVYELKREGSVLVSDFGKANMDCLVGGNGTDTRIVEGRIVWEEK